MKILFLRVGIDRGCGKTLAPMLASGAFEYVPIPEAPDKVHGLKGLPYAHIPARIGGGTLEKYVKQGGYAHYDPEFTSMTYGDPGHPKRFQLLRLDAGDMLVFYAGFQGPAIEPGTCAVIGYLTVKAVHEMPPSGIWPPENLRHLAANAHFRRPQPEPSLVIVEGTPQGSQLLIYAKILSTGQQRVDPAVEAIIGFRGSVKRAIGRWVPSTHISRAQAWLLATP